MLIPMKRLTLAAMRSEESKIMDKLQQISAVQVISMGEMSPDEAQSIVKKENDLLQLKKSAQSLKAYAPKVSPLAPKAEKTLEQLGDDFILSKEICDKTENLISEKTKLKGEIDKALSVIESLEPWRELDENLEDIRPTRSAIYITGMIKDSDIEKLESIENASVTIYGGEKEKAFLLVCLKGDSESVISKLKELSYTEISFKGLKGTPLDNISRLDKDIALKRAELEKIEKELEGLGLKRDNILSGEDAVSIELEKELSKSYLLKTESVFVLEGWVRSDETEKVIDAVRSVSESAYVEFNDPKADEVPPSVVKNNKIIKPFEAVTNMYSRPAPNGIDATPLMSPFYFLFFGMMLGDTGYGLALMIICFVIQKLKKPRGAFADLIKVLIYCGLSTFICGFFMGSFCGIDFDDIFHTNNVFPLLFDPAVDSMLTMYVCFGLGIVHLMFGLLIQAVYRIKNKDIGGAIFDDISWVLLICGVLIYALAENVKNIGLAMLLLGVFLIVFFAGRAKKNPILRLIGGVKELYGVTSYLSDILSYSRIFALALSSGVIAVVLNQLGTMLRDGVGGILGFVLMMIVMVFAHTFSLAINALGCFVHAARLQYVEFFGKFYEAGGTEFKPLGYNTKNTYVKN